MLYSTNKNTDKFLRDSVGFLRQNKAHLKLLNHHDRFGLYIYEDRELRISRPEKFLKPTKSWLDTYVHEYCHFLQSYYETPIYKTYWKPLKSIIYTEKDLKTSNQKLIETQMHIIRQMETECCKMSIGLIKFYDLPINIIQSAKVSNAYIFYHHLVEENKTWKCKDYYSRNILSCMPTRIQSNYAEKMPKKYYKIMSKCFE